MMLVEQLLVLLLGLFVSSLADYGTGSENMGEIISSLENISEILFNNGYNSWGNTIRKAIAILKEQDSGWISVNDRLPELNQEVLVYAVGKIDGFIGKHTIEICNRFIQRIYPSSPGQEMWSSPYQYFHTDYEITHWMPLPEPPKEGR